MRARGVFSCEPRNFHVFPLDNSDIQKPSVNQRSIPFQNYHRIEKPAKFMMTEKLTHTLQTLILNYFVNSKTRQKMIVLFLPIKRSSFVSAIFLINCWLVSKTMAVILSIILSHHNHHYHHPHPHHHLRHQHYWLNDLRKKATESATNIVSVSVWLWSLLEGFSIIVCINRFFM